jgi:hypothetical protein
MARAAFDDATFSFLLIQTMHNTSATQKRFERLGLPALLKSAQAGMGTYACDPILDRGRKERMSAGILAGVLVR